MEPKNSKVYGNFNIISRNSEMSGVKAVKVCHFSLRYKTLQGSTCSTVNTSVLDISHESRRFSIVVLMLQRARLITTLNVQELILSLPAVGILLPCCRLKHNIIIIRYRQPYNPKTKRKKQQKNHILFPILFLKRKKERISKNCHFCRGIDYSSEKYKQFDIPQESHQ